MTDKHPITPPDELRRLWAQQAQRIDPRDPVAWMQHVSTAAAQWGADQELEACCEWLGGYTSDRMAIYFLRDARRPKPLSEADLALDALGPEPLPENTPSGYTFLNGGAIEGHRRIRRALERLKKLEQLND